MDLTSLESQVISPPIPPAALILFRRQRFEAAVTVPPWREVCAASGRLPELSVGMAPSLHIILEIRCSPYANAISGLLVRRSGLEHAEHLDMDVS